MKHLEKTIGDLQRVQADGSAVGKVPVEGSNGQAMGAGDGHGRRARDHFAPEEMK